MATQPNSSPNGGAQGGGAPRRGAGRSASGHDSPLLALLGQRLRASREAQDLSISDLARRAGLSRRYVTDAEAGRANLTVLRLVDLAQVLGIPMAELCDLPLAPRTERIALVGLRGAGKTTVGRLLAQRLEVPFVELDERVESKAGLSLAEIFDLQGAETYRRLEREVLEEVLAEGQRQVIATGGSIVTAERTFARLRTSCHTVWLRAAPEEHLRRVLGQGDRRPMEGRPAALDELREILARRDALYALCEATVDTDLQSAEGVADDIATRFTLESGNGG